MTLPCYESSLICQEAENHSIFYLPTVAHFSIRFYEEKVRMSEGSSYTFQSCVSKSHVKAELAKERRKAKGKKKAQAHDSDENQENVPSSTSDSSF
jgi:hypothetical protein